MTTPKVLAYRIWVAKDDGELIEFQAGDALPAWAARKVDNPGAFAEGDGPSDDGEGDGPGDDGEGDGPGDDGEVSDDYASWKKADLEAEVDRRNEGRDDEDLIEVAEPGNKAELVAALVADDADQES